MSDHFDWTTQSELKFVAGLGSFAKEMGDKPTREELLRRYLIAANNRANWGGMNRRAVLSFANESLRQQEKLNALQSM